MDDLLIHWTIRLALAAYTFHLLAAACPFYPRTLRQRAVGLAWQLSGLLLAAHAVAAMHLFHHWSLEHAIADTARQTGELMGVEFGQGIWFSFLLIGVWWGDILWAWLAPQSHARRPAWLTYALHGYAFFILFNGAIVFERGVTRPVGVVVCGLVGSIFIAQQIRLSRTSDSSTDSRPESTSSPPSPATDIVPKT